MSFGLKICGKIDLMGPTKRQLLILQLVVYAEIWLLLGIFLGLSTGLYRLAGRSTGHRTEKYGLLGVELFLYR